MKELTIRQMARKGGNSTKKKYGIEHYRAIQKKGVEKRKLNKLKQNEIKS